MKYRILFLFLILMVAGCEVPQPGSPVPPESTPEGLKITDLKDNTMPVNAETLMKFKVLTYTLAPDSVGRLKEVFDELSDKDVRIVNKGAFVANGFMVGTASLEDGGVIAQKLAHMGATRTAQGWLVFPPDKIETLSRTPLRGTEVIHYATSASGTATMMPGAGLLGWFFSARPDLRFRGTAQVKLFPASWQPGLEHIRLVMGQEALDYKPIQQGRILARIEEGGVLLLGPARKVPEETTLDKMLFFLPGRRPKVQFFVIICNSAGI